VVNARYSTREGLCNGFVAWVWGDFWNREPICFDLWSTAFNEPEGCLLEAQEFLFLGERNENMEGENKLDFRSLRQKCGIREFSLD
jgi:hypothetical protein